MLNKIIFNGIYQKRGCASVFIHRRYSLNVNQKRMILRFLLLICFLFTTYTHAQDLKLRARNGNAHTGSDFFKLISDSTLKIEKREKLIYREIKKGNIPSFMRRFKQINYVDTINEKVYHLRFYVLPDFLCIGSDDDHCYIPMTPNLAQKVATLTKCILPTKKISDIIYQNATIKLIPQPISPNKMMSTVPVFVNHNEIVTQQLGSFKKDSNTLIAGNKKDIIISKKIYGEDSPRVVIYGWHKPDGKAIQPVYNKHTSLWVDYSHGVRLVSNKAFLNDNLVTLTEILKDEKFSKILSDEGPIAKPYYPNK